jgi:hypothetical protein
MENAQGHYVPIANVSDLDWLRNEMVDELVESARRVAASSARFTALSEETVAEFVALSAESHGVRLGGGKGNVTLTSYDGRRRVVRARADAITFNEAVATVREAVLACVRKWSVGANPNLSELVAKAFETDRHGQLSAAKILALKSYRIQDDDWANAMRALDDAVQVAGTNQYLRFYEKDAAGVFRQIALDGSGAREAPGKEAAGEDKLGDGGAAAP